MYRALDLLSALTNALLRRRKTQRPNKTAYQRKPPAAR